MILQGNFPRWKSLISFCFISVSEVACRFHLCVQMRYLFHQEATDGVHRASRPVYTRVHYLARCCPLFPFAVETRAREGG